MRVLTVNPGSSSIKLSLLEADDTASVHIELRSASASCMVAATTPIRS
ncbi:hypothetical protein [Actinomadura napierensis]|uniref:Butyrate kinase n=1 Tax=Actinomadura napierensis TaxID=267854 RepID=A0ABP5KCG7_9ACTN